MNAAPFFSQPGDLSGISMLMALSIVVLMFVCLFLYKVYRASLNVQSRLNEFSRITPNDLSSRLTLLEIESEEYHLNREALGPLARLIDEYCVLMIASDGQVTYVNDRMTRILGLQAQSIARKKIDLLDSHGKENGWREISGSLRPKKVWHGEIYGCNFSRNEYWLDAFALPLSFITDDEDGWLFFATDISHLKSANKALEDRIRRKEEEISRVENMLFHSEKMASLGTISAGIAHEINSPIAFVSCNLNMLRKNTRKLATLVPSLLRLPASNAGGSGDNISDIGEPVASQINAILQDSSDLVSETIDGVDRVKKIITDLRSFAHDSQGENEPIRVDECINSALNLARHDIGNKVEVQVSIEHPCDALICGSATQLTQVLVNLLVNAAQAMNHQGQISILTSAEQSHLVISVSDSGPGIDQHIIDRIFEPFFTTKGVGAGTGLGLSISQDIINRHNGQLTARNMPGQGSCFSIEIPTLQEKAACGR